MRQLENRARHPRHHTTVLLRKRPSAEGRRQSWQLARPSLNGTLVRAVRLPRELTSRTRDVPADEVRDTRTASSSAGRQVFPEQPNTSTWRSSIIGGPALQKASQRCGLMRRPNATVRCPETRRLARAATGQDHLQSRVVSNTPTLRDLRPQAVLPFGPFSRAGARWGKNVADGKQRTSRYGRGPTLRR